MTAPTGVTAATSRTLDDALRLDAHGWSLLPMLGKKPHSQVLMEVHGTSRWTPLCERRASAVDVRAWFEVAPDAGLGLIVHPGLVVVDVDDATRFHHQHPPTPTVASGSGRGFHLYFAGDVQRAHTFGWGEVRGAESIVVLPPSRHLKTGAEYEWRIGLDEIEMAALPAALNPSLNSSLTRPTLVTFPRTSGPREVSVEPALNQSSGAEDSTSWIHDLTRDAAAVSRALHYLGRPGALNLRTGRATTFRCLLPKHTDIDASASIYRSKHGAWRYHCYGCDAWLSLPRLYRAVTSKRVDWDDKLRGPAAARWLARLWHDSGVAPVELLPMPKPDGPRELQQVAEGFRLLASIRVSLGDLDPVPYTKSFAAEWAGVPIEAPIRL